jgi:hypothetical protein
MSLEAVRLARTARGDRDVGMGEELGVEVSRDGIPMDRSMTEALVRDRMRARLAEAQQERLAKTASSKPKHATTDRRRAFLPRLGKFAPDMLRRRTGDIRTS